MDTDKNIASLAEMTSYFTLAALPIHIVKQQLQSKVVSYSNKRWAWSWSRFLGSQPAGDINRPYYLKFISLSQYCNLPYPSEGKVGKTSARLYSPSSAELLLVWTQPTFAATFSTFIRFTLPWVNHRNTSTSLTCNTGLAFSAK